MKKYLFFLMFVVGTLCTTAQFYNPYYNPYYNSQARQDAFEWGRKMAEELQAQQQQAYNRGSAMGLVLAGRISIAEGNYEQAYKSFSKAVEEYDHTEAYGWLGACLELGLGCKRNTRNAHIYYNLGVSRGDSGCRAAIDRINSSGYWTEANKSNFIQLVKNSIQAQMINYDTNNIWNNSGGYNSSGNSSGSGRRVCPSCNGSKKGTDNIYYSPDYTGNQANEYCPTCNKWTSPHSHSTPSCPVCYGRGYVE